MALSEIKGNIVDVIYDNPETGYRILAVHTGKKIETVRGNMPEVYAGAEISAEGEYSTHPVYGEQFCARNVIVETPTSKTGIRAFLSSGLISGVGPETAKKIVAAFGEQTLDVIENSPDELRAIKGLSANKINLIREAVKSTKESAEAIAFFSRLGIGTNLSMRAYKAYGKNTVSVVSQNPYKLADEIYGFTFQTADRIASQIGIAENDIYRVSSCALYILRQIYVEGHCYLPRSVLLDNVRKFVQIDDETFETALKMLEQNEKTVRVYKNGEQIIYQKYIYSAERGIERLLLNISSQKIKTNSKNADKAIADFENSNSLKLDYCQKEAVKSATERGVVVITGGPGTGKTTIIKAIISAMAAEGKKCLLAAPTGRAAKRMAAACNQEAKTLHRLLEIDFSVETEIRNDENLRFKRNPERPLKCDTLIIDEVSMVDTVLMYHTLRALGHGAQLVLVGDKDQLPSVGPGRVLRDIIESDKFKVVTLTDIYRQNTNSLISYNARKVNLGEMPEMNIKEGDFFLLPAHNSEETLNLVCDLVGRRLPNTYNIDPLSDIQVITPNRKGASGAEALSRAIQEKLNPKTNRTKLMKEGDTEFRKGDRVMQIKNNYEMTWEDFDDPTIYGVGVFNGEMGVIVEVNEKEKLLYVLFDDNRYACYDKMHLPELELCYAITVHKSQGSEFDYCIIPIVGVFPQLKTRNLIYTAITRAKKMAILIGTPDTLREIIDNNTEQYRYTSLFPGDEE